MHGNIREWCEDDYHENYEGAPEDGSAWLSNDNRNTKVIRGGSWYDITWYCRSAYRNFNLRDFHFSNLGFRVVRVLSSI